VVKGDVETRYGGQLPGSIEFQASGIPVLLEGADRGEMTTEEIRDCRCGLVAAAQPYDLGRWSSDRREVGEIRVVRNQDEPMGSSEVPNDPVVNLIKSEEMNLAGVGEDPGERLTQSIAEVLIEQQSHAAAVTMRLSRSAA
jgi:hypothetical protein